MTLLNDNGVSLREDDPNEPYMRFQDVGLRYSERGPAILSDINLDVKKGEIVCLLGASGCGKSTLLNVAAGFLEPTQGKALLQGSEISGPGADRVMVFQEDAVFPWYTVRQNVAYGLRVRGVSKQETAELVNDAINLVGLTEYADAYPRELSGGMRKRCDMARAIVLRPESILMDEPFAALDVMTKERLQVQFREISEAQNSTSLFVTHDLEEALFVGTRIAILRKGAGPFLTLADVPFGAHREVEIKTSPEFQKLRRELADVIASDPSHRKAA
ncbi:ABC transporter ATP-binding protein [Microbacterium sp. NPDC089696]|uniref:ABC transporter ATP-binding protein n=1 Tax=Microbacterium sp. NPDC089696 TaxID=3364199 RepID=UPI00382DB5F2